MTIHVSGGERRISLPYGHTKRSGAKREQTLGTYQCHVTITSRSRAQRHGFDRRLRALVPATVVNLITATTTVATRVTRSRQGQEFLSWNSSRNQVRYDPVANETVNLPFQTPATQLET